MFKIAILVVLIRVLDITGKHITCAALYALSALSINLFMYNYFERPLSEIDVTTADLLVRAAITFAAGLFYFWLLRKIEGFAWWCVAVPGFLIVLALS